MNQRVKVTLGVGVATWFHPSDPARLMTVGQQVCYMNSERFSLIDRETIRNMESGWKPPDP